MPQLTELAARWFSVVVSFGAGVTEEEYPEQRVKVQSQLDEAIQARERE